MRLPDIKIDINGVNYDNTFEQDVRIDRTQLDDEFATQAEKYAYYAFLSEEAKASHDWKKFEMERLYAVVDHEKRVAAHALSAQNKGFKYTETMCENEVITDKRYVAKMEEVLNAKRLAGILEQAARAIAQRRDMLMQLGANNRTGMAPQRVMEQKQETVRGIVAANQPANMPPPSALDLDPEPTTEPDPEPEPPVEEQPRRRRSPRGTE